MENLKQKRQYDSSPDDCPMCEKPAKVRQLEVKGKLMYKAGCPKCKMAGPVRTTEKKAKTIWNYIAHLVAGDLCVKMGLKTMRGDNDGEE